MPKERTAQAAKRRLKEEMGFTCKLKKVFDFIYKVNFKNRLSENEFDNVFIGKFNGTPSPNPLEVDDWKWISIKALKKDIKKNPKKYTYWFKKILQEPNFCKLIDNELNLIK